MSHLISEELPTIKEELERKTVEVLERLVFRHETHRISKDHLSNAAKTIWNITSGLVGDEIAALCSATADMATVPDRMKRHFVGKGKVLTVTWLPEGTGYAIVKRDAAIGESPVVRAIKSEVGLREAELEKLFSVLAKSGYTEL